jgi:hypothetical protein
MEPLIKKGAETGAAFAGSRALQHAKRGHFKKALLWGIPLAAAVVLLVRYRGR